MVNTHELNLDAMAFEQLRNNSYIILQTNDIEVEDYILFRQPDTNLFMMTQVTQIVQNDGLKAGYGLIMFNKL